jgi:hypothetical protein
MSGCLLNEARNRPQKHHLAGGSSGPVAGKDIVFEILLDSLATPEIASFESSRRIICAANSLALATYAEISGAGLDLSRARGELESQGPHLVGKSFQRIVANDRGQRNRRAGASARQAQ